ncbi:MAG: glycosyl-4,4'-diaponeurosporenoate acyltransferase [Candidatus Saccharicenans sp.]|nr:glycosyl-4,4'-diaponeurosporenoate acyltransferase [Candidatus Saccharicenans sp.]
MKIFQLSPAIVLLLNFGLWPVIHFLAGYIAARRPRSSYHPEASLYRLKKFESGGKIYEQLGVRVWKAWLPDFGDFFKPGFRKKRLESKNRDYLQDFYVETCRAEFAHWLTMAGAPLFLLWNEWWVELIMIGYALAVNVPCIIVQRYNRGRLERLLIKIKY